MTTIDDGCGFFKWKGGESSVFAFDERTLDGLQRGLVAQADVLPETQLTGLVLAAKHTALAGKDHLLLLEALLVLIRHVDEGKLKYTDTGKHQAKRKME